MAIEDATTDAPPLGTTPKASHPSTAVPVLSLAPTSNKDAHTVDGEQAQERKKKKMEEPLTAAKRKFPVSELRIVREALEGLVRDEHLGTELTFCMHVD